MWGGSDVVAANTNTKVRCRQRNVGMSNNTKLTGAVMMLLLLSSFRL